MSEGEYSSIKLSTDCNGKHKIGGKFFKSLTDAWSLGGLNKQLDMREGLITLINMTKNSSISDKFKKDISLARNKYKISLRGPSHDTIEVAIIIAIAKGVITKKEVLKLLNEKPKDGN